MTLTSTVLEEGGDVPEKYTCDGEDLNPPLEISGVPAGTETLALVMDDPDAPIGTFDHWVVFNIPPETMSIQEGQEPDGTLGSATSGEQGYKGPCPPGERHRYIFRVYALDTSLDLSAGVSKADLEEAMEGHILAEAQLTTYFAR